MIKTIIRQAILSLAVFVTAFPASADDNGFFNDMEVTARVGYALGGTAPLGMPATIRKVESFPLKFNYELGVEALKPLDDKWGVALGLRFENNSMEDDALVKNYHMEIVRSGERLEGMFTGNVVTKVTRRMITVPVQAAYRLSSKVRLNLGPYVNFTTSRHFTGWAYDGYLRVGNPTGPKVEMGHNEDERGEYDFSHNMRHVTWGALLGVDWKFHQRWGAYADLSWGFNGIHHSDFKTVEQTLYPIFGTIGITYQIK